MIGAIFLGFYSLETGHSQTLGIFILIILFIYNGFSHLLKHINFIIHSFHSIKKGSLDDTFTSSTTT